MEIFLESPIAVVAAGIVLLAITAYVWVNTGRREALWGMGVIALLTVVMLFVCETVITDREALRQTLKEIALMVETNDAASVPRYVVRSKPELADQGQREMGRHKFEGCTITKIHEINIDPKHQPPRAEVTFNASVGGEFLDGQYSSPNVIRGFTVIFLKEDDGKWRVESYEHYEPTRFMFEKGKGPTGVDE
jgi:hypothetical protein